MLLCRTLPGIISFFSNFPFVFTGCLVFYMEVLCFEGKEIFLFCFGSTISIQ